ncbi:DNA-directed RNA polymerase III subunit RPC17 KNAG_0M01420 [Huiozyma naganishii CBS 8797]|uniref:DNA-directed RNA polymerase III subunit RPC9 n=1 Tax=Huiozyma naganishii (strain ATCC MYA-139 / BCRC 22969 / CBS 8797 / KCTC 17520 / NBRC 10181 / NCYC 3082 / Yp74L-3) TaxID=1071383 RepID=J7RDT5_HUIN7|nr:hypothetical protein KNAG_0M01420 [Kazachstania naganishii CBS 8797]CCK72995.1 hypothetical protein KNAG_0M01420 [Kazachstania naganishii CBS 8797]
MRILDPRDAFLADYEVLQFLTQLQRKHKWDPAGVDTQQQQQQQFRRGVYHNPPLEAITRDTVAYLSQNRNVVAVPGDGDGDETAQTAKSGITRLTDATFSELMRELNSYELLKVEKLQIVNQLPTNMVHLFALVEECDARFSEEQIDAMLATVARYTQAS